MSRCRLGCKQTRVGNCVISTFVTVSLHRVIKGFFSDSENRPPDDDNFVEGFRKVDKKEAALVF